MKKPKRKKPKHKKLKEWTPKPVGKVPSEDREKAIDARVERMEKR